MQVEIIAIGNELLLGFTTDTNSTYLSRALSEIGVAVVRRTTVGDNVPDIAAELRTALERTGAVITSGGLGPTLDDVSREAVAAVFGRALVEEPAIVEHLAALFRSRGHGGELPATNRRQALVPGGARIMRNHHGTAPGIWIEDEQKRWVAMLPGVPSELRGIFEDELRGLILARVTPGSVILSRTLRTTGIAESVLAQRIEDSGLVVDSLAYLPGVEGVDLRVTVRGSSEATARGDLDRAIEELRGVVGRFGYAEGNDDLAGIVLDLARARGCRIAVAESCTGGMLGQRLSAIPGASDVFVGGVIAYSNEIKRKILAVPSETIESSGAVSEATVRAMAAGARARTGARLAAAVSGVAGPGGGSESKPVGTVWIAVDLDGRCEARSRVFPGNREEIRQRAAQMALDMMRIRLLD